MNSPVGYMVVTGARDWSAMALGAIVASCLSLSAVISGAAAVSVGVLHLKPAAPTVERGTV
jgi:hypothetical protein